MGIKVEIVDYFSFPSYDQAQTVATIIVSARFDVNPSIILGRDKYGVSIQCMSHVNGQTVLFVSSDIFGSDEAQRKAAIKIVVKRLERFLNNPAQAGKMYLENPFPEPDED